MLSLLATAYVVAVAMHLWGKDDWAKVFGTPALIMAGWATLGHLVTLDDDSPGGWSNPDGSRALWYRSLGELLIKTVILLSLLFMVYL